MNEKRATPELLITNCILTDDPSGEMYLVASSANTEKPALHLSLSLNEGEKGTSEQWCRAVYEYIHKMGFDLELTQFVAIKHHDTDNEHVHVMINRVQLDGKLVGDSLERKRSHEATRKAEIAGGFIRFDHATAQSSKKGKFNKIREALDDAILKANGDAEKFKALLAQQKMNVIENRAKDGRLNGLSFQPVGEKGFKGSEIGKEYSAGGLQKRGLELGYIFNEPAVNQVPVDWLAEMRAKRAVEPSPKPF